jgi:hypothetical protein
MSRLFLSKIPWLTGKHCLGVRDLLLQFINLSIMLTNMCVVQPYCYLGSLLRGRHLAGTYFFFARAGPRHRFFQDTTSRPVRYRGYWRIGYPRLGPPVGVQLSLGRAVWPGGNVWGWARGRGELMGEFMRKLKVMNNFAGFDPTMELLCIGCFQK